MSIEGHLNLANGNDALTGSGFIDVIRGRPLHILIANLSNKRIQIPEHMQVSVTQNTQYA